MTVVDPNVGFIRPTLAEITNAIQNDYWSNIDPGLDLSPEGPYGQAIALQADREDALWELLEYVYHSWDPRKAKSFELDGLCLINGVIRKQASFGIVTVTITGVGPVDVPTTFTIRDPANPSNRWHLQTALSVVAAGAFTMDVDFEAEQAGNYPALAGTLTEIVTPVAGVNTVTNALAASPGNALEEDGDLRARRDASLVGQGLYPIDAMRAALLNVEGVSEVLILENPAPTFNSDGLPPYAIEAIIDGTAYSADSVAAAIWAHRAAGTPLYSADGSFGFVYDAEGAAHIVVYSAATVVEMMINCTVETDPALFPLDGVLRIQTLLAEYSESFHLGQDVMQLKLKALCLDVPGVTDVTDLEMKSTTDVLFINTNYAIEKRQRAHIDASNVAVSVT